MAVEPTHPRRALRLDALLSTVLLLGVLVVLLVVSQERHTRVDLSDDANATLAAELLLAVREVDDAERTVSITAFSAQRRDEQALLRDRTVRDVLAELELRSPHLTTQFVDFDADPVTAERLGVTRYGAVVVQAGEVRVDLSERELFPVQRTAAGVVRPFVGEALLARALQQVVATEPRVACFVTGHGERSPTDGSRSGLGALASVLVADGWTVRACDLMSGGITEVPADVTAVWWVAPRMPVPTAESDALAAYLRRGGGLVVMLDTRAMVPDLVEAIGVTVPAGELRDASFVPPNPERPILAVRPHRLTDSLRQLDVRPQLSGVVALRSRPVQGATITPLLQTSSSGWLEPEEGVPTEGPEPTREVLSAAVAVELDLPHPLGAVDGARVAVLGDADWAGPELLADGPGNRTLALSLARWIGGAPPPPALTEARPPTRMLALTPAQARRAQWFLVGGLPLLTLLIGLAVARARRLL